MIDAALLSRVTSASVHFATDDEVDDFRDALLRTSNVYESGEAAMDRDSLFRVLAEAMKVAEGPCENWDAVVDGLRCLEAAGARRGFVLLLHHARRLWREAPDAAGTLVETWLSVAEERREFDESFHLVFVW